MKRIMMFVVILLFASSIGFAQGGKYDFSDFKRTSRHGEESAIDPAFKLRLERVDPSKLSDSDRDTIRGGAGDDTIYEGYFTEEQRARLGRLETDVQRRICPNLVKVFLDLDAVGVRSSEGKSVVMTIERGDKGIISPPMPFRVENVPIFVCVDDVIDFKLSYEGNLVYIDPNPPSDQTLDASERRWFFSLRPAVNGACEFGDMTAETNMAEEDLTIGEGNIQCLKVKSAMRPGFWQRFKNYFREPPTVEDDEQQGVPRQPGRFEP